MAELSTAEKVLEETHRFRAALPELLNQNAGKWVVFKDGRPRSFHETEEEAYQEGLRTLGRDGGQVIAQVVEEHPTPITAGVLFNVA